MSMELRFPKLPSRRNKVKSKAPWMGAEALMQDAEQQ